MVAGPKRPPTKSREYQDRVDKSESIKRAESAAAMDAHEDEAKFTKAKADREAKALEIADRTETGKKLTKTQEELLKKSPAIRLLVKNEFKKRELNIEEMYVDVLHDSYKESKDEEIRSDIRLKHRRFVANEISAFAGLHATADDKKRPDTNIHLHVDEGLYLQIEDNDGNKTQLQAVRQAEGTPQTAEIISDTDSCVREESG